MGERPGWQMKRRGAVTPDWGKYLSRIALGEFSCQHRGMSKYDFPPEIWDEIIAPSEVIDLSILVDSILVGIAFTVVALIGGLFG